METGQNPEETAVIELMVTWGATARPAAGEMFEALATAVGADAREPLRRLLELEPDTLDPALRADIATVCNAAAGAMPAASRIEALATEARQALREVSGSRRRRLEGDLANWSGLLEPADREAIWTLLWQVDRDEVLEDTLSGLAVLRQAAERLDQARQRVRDEIAAFVRAPEGADEAALQAARQALETDDPGGMAAARARLRDLSADARRAELETRVDVARGRLAELRDNARRELEGSGSGLGPASRRILESGLARADALLSATEATKPEQAETVLPAVESWARTLAVALDGTSARAERARDSGLAAWAQDLAREVEASSVAAETGRAEEGQAIATELKTADDDAPLALFAAGARAMSWIETVRGRRAEDLERAAEELGATRRALEEQLERSASILPTQRVIDARVLLDRIDEALAGEKLEDLRSLRETAAAMTPELDRLAASYREYRSGREAAERRRIAREAEGWLELAGKRDAAKLETLAAETRNADPDRLADLRDRVDAAGARIGNAIRLDAARTLRRAGSRADTERLRTALEADDLPALVEATAATREGLRGFSRLGWPARLAMIGILAAVLGGGGFWVWRLRSEAATPYEFRLASGVDTTGGARLTLVLDGEVFGEQSFDADGTARLELPGGQYDVYVNGAFTGRVLRVPDDATEVTDIPIPR